jgi:hypothetical protein
VPLSLPALDDRSFQDLVDELLARIPGHVPEWTNPRVGDPGRTLIELFAWLGDTLLYRANLIPERQRLAFLRLLGAPMRPAAPARGLVTLINDGAPAAVALRAQASVKGAGPLAFETRDEVTVLPITAEGFYKRPPSPAERAALGPLLDDLATLYQTAPDKVSYYVSTRVFARGATARPAFDMVQDTVDASLWLALLAKTKADVAASRHALGSEPGARKLLNLGVVPALEVPEPFADMGPAARVQLSCSISTGKKVARVPEYLPLEALSNGPALLRRGVVRLELPTAEQIGALNDGDQDLLEQGVGDDRPPRIDDADLAERLVCWVRVRPADALASFPLTWVGVNVVEIDQRHTASGTAVGISSGLADQVLPLPATQIEPESFVLEVEEEDGRFQIWTAVPDLALGSRDDAIFVLDAEAGTIRFGDGLRGRIPAPGRRVRAAQMRAGGGRAGNLPARQLEAASGHDQQGNQVTGLKVLQPLPLEGGVDAESLADAERRIPGLLRDRERAVTEEDFRRLAADAPGLLVGRVEVLPRFKPQQRRFDVPGIVTVMALPQKDGLLPPNPRPDRSFIERVFAHVDRRRPLATELYVVGAEYVPLSVSVGVVIADGAGQDEVLTAVRESVRRFLWPLVPGGPGRLGWPLGRAVRDREIEVVVAQVPGVVEVRGINLFRRTGEDWTRIQSASSNQGAAALSLERWQLPELLGVVAVIGDAPTDGRSFAPPATQGPLLLVPVVAEVC